MRRFAHGESRPRAKSTFDEAEPARPDPVAVFADAGHHRHLVPPRPGRPPRGLIRCDQKYQSSVTTIISRRFMLPEPPSGHSAFASRESFRFHPGRVPPLSLDGCVPDRSLAAPCAAAEHPKANAVKNQNSLWKAKSWTRFPAPQQISAIVIPTPQSRLRGSRIKRQAPSARQPNAANPAARPTAPISAINHIGTEWKTR